MSGSTPIYRSSERIQGQALVDTSTGDGGSMAALSRSFGELQRVFTGAAQDIKQANDTAQIGRDQRDILTRPMRDPEGNYTVPDFGDWETRTGAARNRLILSRMGDEAQVEARERAVTIRQEAGNDPQRFAALYSGWSDGRLAAMPEGVRETARGAFASVGTQHFTAMTGEVIHREERNQQQGWSSNLQAQTADLEGLVRAGQIGSPEYQRAEANVQGLLERGVRDGHLSAEAAQVQRDALAERVGGVAVVRAGMDRLGQGATAEEVLRDFDGEADRRALPIATRERLRNLLESRINERRSVQAEQRSEIGVEWTDMRARLTGGVPVEATEVDGLARRAEGAGARATAAEIRRTQEVYSDLRDAQSMSLPELRRLQAATVQRVATDPNASSRQAILAEMLGQAVTRRAEAMRADPLGTAARTHRDNPNGGQLAALDFSSPEALGNGLQARAGQARRLGALEGMPNSMPVLTAPEAAQLSTLVREGTREQQMGLLSAMTRLPADTMRRTMEGMLPGTETERDPRVLSFMAAAGVSQRDPRLGREIIAGQERLRATPAPALNGAEVDRYIEAQIGEAYAVNPAAYASVRAAARSVYAERAATGLDPTQPGASRSDPGLAGRFDSGLMRRVLRDVAPTISFNGQTVPPPVREGRLMTEAEFTDQMRNIPPHVLTGARAANGAQITGDMIRRNGALIATGEGQYGLTISGFRVNGADGRPFRLDARQPWPAAPPNDFRNRLRQSESGQQPGIVNREGFAGLYQFGSERLAELSFYSPAPGEGRNGWRGTFNIPGFPQVRTLADFRANPQAQEMVANAHFAGIDAAIERLPPGTNLRDREGLRAVAHLGGVEGMRQFVQTNGAYDPADSNGTKLSTYYRRFASAS